MLVGWEWIYISWKVDEGVVVGLDPSHSSRSPPKIFAKEMGSRYEV